MSRVGDDEQLAQGLALRRGHVRDGSFKVRLVLLTSVLGLEQQDQLGHQVRDALVGAVDDLAVRESDPLIAAADPGVAVVRFSEHVEQVVARSRIAQPCLMYGSEHIRCGVLPDPAAASRIKDESAKTAADLGEASGRDRDLDVPMSARLPAAKQIQGPTGGHAPGRRDPGQVACDFDRGPAG